MKPSKLLLTLAGAVALASTSAGAAPVASTTEWHVEGRAAYKPAEGILWGYVEVKELDGTKLTMGCQSGPFTPHASDGRIRVSDIVAGKPDIYGRPGPSTGASRETIRYAKDAQGCEDALRAIVKSINQNRQSRVIIDELTGKILVGSLN